MKKHIFHFSIIIFSFFEIDAQMPAVIKTALSGTETHLNISYAGDTLLQHTLDVYIPANTNKPLPLLVWIHGGGWRAGSKYTDMDYMSNTLKAIINEGFAVASIDYRFSSTAIFPAQIQDCHRAINYLYDNATKYHFDKSRIGVIGFSAGGYLAALIATSSNNDIETFYDRKRKPPFKIKAAIDFFGPTDFIARIGSMLLDEGENKSTTTLLLGAQPLARPDLARMASPTTYIDSSDPPFLIFHGDADKTVPITLSKLFDSYLQLAHVPTEFIVVPGAPHAGPMFGSEDIKTKVVSFLNKNLK